MTDSNAVANLLAWCSEHNIWVDPRIRIISGSYGVAVCSKDDTIPENSILVRIPRQSVLSVKSSPIGELIPLHLYGRGAQLSLALALSVELSKNTSSSWYGYLQSLPVEIPGIPLYWTSGTESTNSLPENSSPTEWLHGTEAEKSLLGSGESDHGLLNEINEYYCEVGQPVYSQVFHSSPDMIPPLGAFYHAYALVSSRSFLVDSYHGLSMVPIADAFNHAQDNHVHLESDFDVCPECGSFQRCAHDQDAAGPMPRPTIPTDVEDCFEMVSNLPIPPNTEVFNTYGETLSNAQLLVQYGFILDANENDHLTWTFAELAHFTETYFTSPMAWNWDAVGGLEQFQNLHAAVNSLPWDSLSDSELVFCDRTRSFCLNGDAKVSHGLWLYFALLLCLKRDQRPDLTSDELIAPLQEMVECQLILEQTIAEEDAVYVPPSRDVGSPPYGLIRALGHTLAAFCRHRCLRTGKSGVETAELGDILDSLPDDMNPTRMAISLAMTERSLLDSCMSSWEGLLDVLI
ncbi:hypothetical protein C8J57DRAFT_1178190 [Mycena rebaudengoi]|nr:hypothetical protein C8J57DRAFT_1178190 [Mycena rebaudengoi]